MPDPFIWYELMTTDAAAAASFYTSVVGWSARPMEGGGMDYTIFEVPSGEGGVAGLMALPEDAAARGARPGWIGYVHVADVDASAAKAKGLGGVVHKEPADIPGVGRFAIVADPAGAVFALFTPAPRGGAMPTGTGVGFVAWRELMAGDLDTAWAFYSALLGWTKGEAHDMGPMGTYQMFYAGRSELEGGMMTKPQNVPASFWTFYVGVDGIRAAAERIAAGGGQVINGPMQVPGGDWIVQGLDPQGSLFALFSKTE